MKKLLILIITLCSIGAIFATDEEGLTKAQQEQNAHNLAVAEASTPPENSSWGPIGAGLVVIGAGVGIGLFASSAARSIARQPEAAKEITGAVNLPLFLLEGVAIIGLVVCLLATF